MQAKSLETVCIVGAGFMGAQIGLRCAIHGYTVRLVDNAVEQLQQAAQSHSQELDKRLEEQQIKEEEKAAILSRIRFTTRMEEGASEAELVD